MVTVERGFFSKEIEKMERICHKEFFFARERTNGWEGV